MVWSWATWGSESQLAVSQPLTGWVSTAVKSVHGEYYLNGHWTIDAAQALPVANTILHYERGVEGDLAPERLQARGPTSEPLVIEVSGGRCPGQVGCQGYHGPGRGTSAKILSRQLISQEPNPGIHYEYYLPVDDPNRGFSWSHSSWSDCSAECDGGKRWGLEEDRQMTQADKSQPCPQGSTAGEGQLYAWKKLKGPVKGCHPH